MFVQAAELWNKRQKWGTATLAVGAILVVIAIGQPNLLRIKTPPRQLYEQKTMDCVTAPASARAGLQTQNGAAQMRAIPTAEGVVGGVPGGTMGAEIGGARGSAADARKIVRTGYLDLVVSSPVDALSSVQGIAQKTGGYVASSELSGSTGRQQSASVKIGWYILRRAMKSFGWAPKPSAS